MTLVTVALAVAALAVSALLTALVRRLALAQGMLDIPNERSSHSQVTPRGGGMAVFVAATVALLVLVLRGAISRELFLALVGGGFAVAAVGFLDDRRKVPVRARLMVHLLAAAWAVAWLGGPTVLRLGDHLVYLGWTASALAVLGIVWTLNLFNFMDGIDGIATAEAVFVAAAGALLASRASAPAVSAAAWVFSASCAGFLCWNWPPAKVFLGDIGSGYLGYVIAVLALAATRADPVALWVWLILGGVFFVDATVTLLRRLLRGERVYQAHRAHAYQWLARRWGSHAKVTCTAQIVNVLWLLPCALFASRRPQFAASAVLVSLAPLVLFAIVASGRREVSDPNRQQVN
jgi:Fuc2NAc and GlcNAc transferase